MGQTEGIWEKRRDEVSSEGVWVCEWAMPLPLKILLATAPQGAMGDPFWSLTKGLQYELGFCVNMRDIS